MNGPGYTPILEAHRGYTIKSPSGSKNDKFYNVNPDMSQKAFDALSKKWLDRLRKKVSKKVTFRQKLVLFCNMYSNIGAIYDIIRNYKESEYFRSTVSDSQIAEYRKAFVMKASFFMELLDFIEMTPDLSIEYRFPNTHCTK